MPTTATLAKVLTAALALQGGVSQQPLPKSEPYDQLVLTGGRTIALRQYGIDGDIELCKYQQHIPTYIIVPKGLEEDPNALMDGIWMRAGSFFPGHQNLFLTKPGWNIAFKIADFNPSLPPYIFKQISNQTNTTGASIRPVKIVNDQNQQINLNTVFPQAYIDFDERDVHFYDSQTDNALKICDFNADVKYWGLVPESAQDKTPFTKIMIDLAGSKNSGGLTFMDKKGRNVLNAAQIYRFLPEYHLKPVNSTQARKSKKQQLVSKFQNQRNNKR